jgi:hypothetical protein
LRSQEESRKEKVGIKKLKEVRQVEEGKIKK